MRHCTFHRQTEGFCNRVIVQKQGESAIHTNFPLLRIGHGLANTNQLRTGVFLFRILPVLQGHARKVVRLVLSVYRNVGSISLRPFRHKADFTRKVFEHFILQRVFLA